MTANQQDHITNALDHVRADSEALGEVHDAIRSLERAFNAVEALVVGHVELEEEIAAVTRMTDIVRERLVVRLYGEASRAGYLLAQEVIESVRSRSEHESVQWMTGNSFMPPLRSLPEAERVWNEGSEDSWHAFSARFFEALEQAQIYCTSPEYDNALYCVDLRVWEYVPEEEQDEHDDLAYEWRRHLPEGCTGTLHGLTLTHTEPCPVHNAYAEGLAITNEDGPGTTIIAPANEEAPDA